MKFASEVDLDMAGLDKLHFSVWANDFYVCFWLNVDRFWVDNKI